MSTTFLSRDSISSAWRLSVYTLILLDMKLILSCNSRRWSFLLFSTCRRIKLFVLPAMPIHRLDLCGRYDSYIWQDEVEIIADHHQDFHSKTRIANWLSVAGLAVTVTLLLTFVVLPAKWTHRHYLNICLGISMVIMQVSRHNVLLGL